MFGKNHWMGYKDGFKIALEWYFRRIKENKWIIIPFVLDILLIPVKFVIVEILDLTRGGKRAIKTFASTIDWNS